jgi:hypothetical protein
MKYFMVDLPSRLVLTQAQADALFDAIKNGMVVDTSYKGGNSVKYIGPLVISDVKFMPFDADKVDAYKMVAKAQELERTDF